MHNEHEHGLVMPFVVCESVGGPYNDGAFVAGYSASSLDETLRALANLTSNGLASATVQRYVVRRDGRRHLVLRRCPVSAPAGTTGTDTEVEVTWEPMTCAEREALLDALGRDDTGRIDLTKVRVYSSLTDPDGQYGTPRIFTEWDQPLEGFIYR